MKITIDIPQADIPNKQSIIFVGIHFIDGKVCECTYPFEVEQTGYWSAIELLNGLGESVGAIIKCSQCGQERELSKKEFDALHENERFCPSCGAKMIESEGADDQR